MTVQTNYAVQEKVGNAWRFVGKYCKTKLSANDAMLVRRDSGWPQPMKVVKIHTLDRQLATSKNLRTLDLLEDGDIWAEYTAMSGNEYGPAP